MAVLTTSLMAVSGAAFSVSQGPPSGPLTAGRLKAALPTGTDVTGYTFKASEDNTALNTTPDTITVGGAACQKFRDALTGLAATYKTVAEAQRVLHQTGGSLDVQVTILSFADKTAAAKAVTDAKTGLNGCTTIAAKVDGADLTGTVAAIPQLAAAADRVGYVGDVKLAGTPAMISGEAVQDGAAVVDVEVVNPPTSDDAQLQKIGMTINSVSNIVIAKVNAAAG